MRENIQSFWLILKMQKESVFVCLKSETEEVWLTFSGMQSN